MSLFRALVHLALVVSVSGLVPPSLAFVGLAGVADDARLTSTFDRVVHVPALRTRAHARDGQRTDVGRKWTPGSAALPVAVVHVIIPNRPARPSATASILATSSEPSPDRPRGPPSLI